MAQDTGWLSEGYLNQVTRVDTALARVVAALPEHTIIVLSDHGGHDRTRYRCTGRYDCSLVNCRPTIRRNHTIQAPVDLLNIAPTIARILQIPSAADWEGTPVAEIFIEH